MDNTNPRDRHADESARKPSPASRAASGVRSRSSVDAAMPRASMATPANPSASARRLPPAESMPAASIDDATPTLTGDPPAGQPPSDQLPTRNADDDDYGPDDRQHWPRISGYEIVGRLGRG